MNYNHSSPILGVYYYPHGDWELPQIKADLETFKESGLHSIWLFYDPCYDVDSPEKIEVMLNHCAKIGLTVTPALGQFLRLNDHPEVKIVNADGTTSDDPRYWNMGCFRHPKLLEISTSRAIRFFEDFGDHPALYRIDGKPLMNFVHEAYYRNSVPEFGGGYMKPNCYCEYCCDAWRDYLRAHELDPETLPPIDNSNPVLWQQWFDSHADAIPEFLHRLIQATKAAHPVWATHECNDFYPASWQSVYTGNDWWRMGAVLDFGHEDMYPLEFDTRYVCYVFDYAKDIMRSAMGFQGLITANAQSFNSWLGYQLPENSMSEQVYSALAHGALGLVWWNELPGSDPDKRYRMIRQTKQPNAEYAELVKLLNGYELTQAKIALLYSWTTMAAELEDNHTYDTLLMYQLLVQCGYPVDILSETQVANGLITERAYDAVCVMGCAALPQAVHDALDQFGRAGGLIIADHATSITDAYPPSMAKWRGSNEAQKRIYTLPDSTPVPVYLNSGALHPPQDAQILARFEDGTPALCLILHGEGKILLAGSYLGWDYTTYPGYYDLGKMFPFHVKQDTHLRRFLQGLLRDEGIVPPVTSVHPDVEVALWHSPDSFVVFVINHLQDTVQTTVNLPINGNGWQVKGALTGEFVSLEASDHVQWKVDLVGLQGQAFIIYKE